VPRFLFFSLSVSKKHTDTLTYAYSVVSAVNWSPSEHIQNEKRCHVTRWSDNGR